MTSEGLPVLKSDFHSTGAERMEGMKKYGRRGLRGKGKGSGREKQGGRHTDVASSANTITLLLLNLYGVGDAVTRHSSPSNCTPQLSVLRRCRPRTRIPQLRLGCDFLGWE